MRKFTIALLVVAALWQALAAAGQELVVHYAGGFTHALMHWENEGHRHNDDGSFHADTSEDGVRHVALDGGGPGVGLLPDTAALRFFPLGAEARAQLHDPALSPPFLEGPRRPPRLTA